jgi:mannose-6-phosphate isomerase-like protein (cupin superfamily)
VKLTLLLLTSLFFLACSHTAKIVFPNKGYQNIVWTAAEKEKNIAVRHLRASEHSSSHLLRVKGAEKPHYHDEHDLSVTVISGKSVLHFKDHEVVLQKGDVVTIPKGTYHWAENIDAKASVVFATFSPAYRGKDKRLAQ